MLVLRLLDKDSNHYPLVFQSLPANSSRMVYVKPNQLSGSFQKITQFFSANSETLFFDLNLANYPALRKQAFAPAAIFRLRRHDPHYLQQKVNALLTQSPKNSDLPSALEAVFSHFTASAKSKYFIEYICSTLYLLASDPINRTALPKFVELLLQSNVFTKTTTVKFSDTVRPHLLNALSTLLQQKVSLPTVAAGNLLKQLMQESDPNQPHVLKTLDSCLTEAPAEILKHIFSPDANADGNTPTHTLLGSPYWWRTPYATLDFLLRHCPDELKNSQFSGNNKGATPLHVFAKAVKENDLEEIKLKGRRERPRDYLLASSIQAKVADIINACPEPLRSGLFSFDLSDNSLCSYASGRLAFYLMTQTYSHRGFYTNSKRETALHQFAAIGDRDFDAEIVDWIKNNLDKNYCLFEESSDEISIYHLLNFTYAIKLTAYDKKWLTYCFSPTKKGPALAHYINNGMSAEELQLFFGLYPDRDHGIFERNAEGNTVLFVLLVKFKDLLIQLGDDLEKEQAVKASFEKQITMLLEMHTPKQLEEFVTPKVVAMAFSLGFKNPLEAVFVKANTPILYARLLKTAIFFGAFDEYVPLVQSIKNNPIFIKEVLSNPLTAFWIKDLYDEEIANNVNIHFLKVLDGDERAVYLQPSQILKHFRQKDARARTEAKESILALNKTLKKWKENLTFEIFTNSLCDLPLAALQARQLPEIFNLFPHLSGYHLKLAVPALPIDLFVREILKKENLKAEIVLPFATVEQKIALLDEEIKTGQFLAIWAEVKKEVATRVEALKLITDDKQRNREIIAIKKLLKDANISKQTINNLQNASAIYLQGEINAELKFRLQQYIKKAAQEIIQVRTEYPEVQKSISNLQLSVSYEPEPHFRNAITWSLLDKPLRLPVVKENGEIQSTDNCIDACYYQEKREERVKMINGVEHYLLPIGQNKWLPAVHFQIDTNLEKQIDDWKSEHPGWEDYEEIRLELHHT